jgi:hypothetical protein
MNRFKKIIWCGIAAVAIGGFATFHVSLNSHESLPTVMMNVEALSNEGEFGDPCYAGEFNSALPEAVYCYNHCANLEPVNTNIQTCR